MKYGSVGFNKLKINKEMKEEEAEEKKISVRDRIKFFQGLAQKEKTYERQSTNPVRNIFQKKRATDISPFERKQTSSG